MRNPCPLTSSLTLSPSRPLVLPDRSRLYHMTSQSCAYLLSLFHCRLIIIILNPNPSPSLSSLSSYNTILYSLNIYYTSLYIFLYLLSFLATNSFSSPTPLPFIFLHVLLPVCYDATRLSLLLTPYHSVHTLFSPSILSFLQSAICLFVIH